MKRTTTYVSVLLFVLAGLAVRAEEPEAPNLSGVWTLDLTQSEFTGRPAPKSVKVKVDHFEPFLMYEATLVDQEGASHTIKYDGQADGQPYPYEGLFEGQAAVTRVDPFTTTAVIKSTDGTIEMTTKTVVSADGKSLRIERSQKGPAGESSSVEIYIKGGA